MVIYYLKDGKADIITYNGLEELRSALAGECPFDNASHLAVRSGEIMIESVKDKNSLIEIVNQFPANIPGLKTHRDKSDD